MEYLKRTFNTLTGNAFSSQKCEQTIEYSRMDAYLSYVHKILVWEDPTLSWAVLGVLHFLFWLIVYLQMKLYGVIFLAALAVFIIDLYFEQCGLKAQRTPSTDAVREVLNICAEVVLFLKSLRKENASMFCGIMCVVFLGLSFVARTVDGYLLTYLFLLAVFFGPLIFAKLPPEYTVYIKNTLNTISTNEGVLAEKELLPLLTEKDDDADSFISEKTAESVTSSLISGISLMPSYLDAEGSLDGLEEEDLELPQRASQAFILAKAEYSSDSDSEHKNIEFDAAHFNRDSSSDEENSYSKGLLFSETVDSAEPSAVNILQTSMAQSLISNLTAVGTNLLTNVLSSVSKASNRRDSDSDFEIIDSEELNDGT